MLKLVTVAALVALGVTSVAAQTPPAKAPAPAPAAKVQEPEKRRCERSIEETGSRVGGRKICKTEAEWAAERQQKPKGSKRSQENAGNTTGR